MCNIKALVGNGIVRMGEDPEVPEEQRTAEFVSSFLTTIALD
jgi:hypothetical protein